MRRKNGRCGICNAVLSIYNPGAVCFCHQPDDDVPDYSDGGQHFTSGAVGNDAAKTYLFEKGAGEVNFPMGKLKL